LKTRVGFVSNSSSTSFVLYLNDKEQNITTLEDLANLLDVYYDPEDDCNNRRLSMILKDIQNPNNIVTKKVFEHFMKDRLTNGYLPFKFLMSDYHCYDSPTEIFNNISKKLYKRLNRLYPNEGYVLYEELVGNLIKLMSNYLEDKELIDDFHNVIIKKIYQNPEVQKKINEKTKFVKLEYEGTYYDEYSFIDYFRFCPNCIWICDN
jgi:hypothetical protein